MNEIFFTFAFVTDPYFVYKLIGQIILLIILCVVIGWGIYKLLGKLAPRIKKPYKISMAFLIVVILVFLIGFLSEQFGL